jgi:PAS domain S-box-containing protein
VRVQERTTELRPANEQLVSEISDRMRVEEAPRESEQKFRHLVETTSDWIWEVDAAGCYSYACPRVRDLLGYEPAEVLGRSPFDFMTPEEASRLRNEFTRILAEGRPFFGLVNVNRRKDGRLVILETSGVPRLGERGSFLRFHGIDWDITERRQAEEEQRALEWRLLHSQKLESLGVLADGIAHDFNNLLAVILGNADLALAELLPMSPACGNLRDIRDTSIRASDLCRQMLAYSGKGRLVIERMCLKELIEGMLPLLRSSMSKKAQLNLRLEENLPPLQGDATQIRQVLMNLVVNASEALGERSGKVNLSTGAMECSADYLGPGAPGDTPVVGRHTWLEVSDSGCGMDAETQRRMFEPFFTTKFTGRGLGLSAVLGIVRSHKGALKLHSELGRGTTFRVLFPADGADPLPHRTNGGTTEIRKGKGTVLLVDDEEAVPPKRSRTRIHAEQLARRAALDELERRLPRFRPKRRDARRWASTASIFSQVPGVALPG